MVRRYERSIGRAAKPAAKPDRKIKPPEELAYLIEWYDHIRRGMGRGMEVEPLSHAEIRHFKDLHVLTDEDMTSFDVIMLGRLDGPWFKTLPKHTKNPDKPAS